MNNINVLDSTVFNRIAAGEVVNSPSSVVKELVENSIDAESTVIIIDIKKGGTELIRVIDNGIGIDGNNLQKAFLPHATSKINLISDLDSIATLGFRGEALPSIASVSKVSFTSRMQDSELGNFVCFENGKLIDSGQIGCSLGSSVKVESLFKNIPARHKFLKKDSVLEAEISELVLRLILANSNISIKLNVNSKTVFHSSGEGLKSAIYSVYGIQMLEQLDYVESKSDFMSVSGYVNKAAFSKHNRSYQTLIVNGRVVQNTEISYLIYDFFSSVLMKRQYPFYILNLILPFDMVDVNVHPNKLEVKFAGFAQIKNLILQALQSNSKDSFFQAKPIVPSPISKSGTAEKAEKYFSGSFMKVEDMGVQPKTQKLISSYSQKIGSANIIKESSNFMNILDRLDNGTEKKEEKTYSFKNLSAFNEVKQEDCLKEVGCTIIGKAFNTYIIVESGDNLYLIDQHAAHERLLYDKFKAKTENNDVIIQNLLVPYVFSLSPIDFERFGDYLSVFKSMGFELDVFGSGSYCLRSIPAEFAGLELEKFISTLIISVNKGNALKSDFIKDALVQAACKAAVKGEMPLHESEIKSLLNQMKQSNALFCPHGRPIVTQIQKKEIEKWFKRII